MSTMFLYGLIGWLALIGIAGLIEKNYPLMWYGICGAGLNIAVMWMK